MSCNEPKKSILNGAEVSIGSIGSLNLISYWQIQKTGIVLLHRMISESE
jgi:hypothetical protein